MNLKDQVTQYVSKSDLEETFALLLHEKVTTLLEKEGLDTRVYLQSARYNRLKENEMDYLISKDNAQVEYSKLCKALLELVKDWDFEVKITEAEYLVQAKETDGNSDEGKIQHQGLEITFVSKFLKIYEDRGTGGIYDLSIWRPMLPEGFYALGYHAQNSYFTPRTLMPVVKPLEKEALAHPVDYRYVWDDKGSGGVQDMSIWEPIPPKGYRALGSVISLSYQKPALEVVMCVREDLVREGQVGDFIYNDRKTGSNKDLSLWKTWSATPNCLSSGSFCGHPSHQELLQSPLTHVLPIR